jgi:hypothetical protein
MDVDGPATRGLQNRLRGAHVNDLLDVARHIFDEQVGELRALGRAR